MNLIIKLMELKIVDIIDTDFAVTPESGQKVFEILDANFKQEKTTELDFSGVNTMTTAFLNTAIGQLYSIEKYDSNFLSSHLRPINMTKFQIRQIQMVIDGAKKYFFNKEKFDSNIKDSMNGIN